MKYIEVLDKDMWFHVYIDDYDKDGNVIKNERIFENEEVITWDELKEFIDIKKEELKEYQHISVHYVCKGYTMPVECDEEYYTVFISDKMEDFDFTDTTIEKIEAKLEKILLDLYHEALDIHQDEGGLEYIKINKLFGKYDVYIDLTSPVNILIGANGIGKTTIIKILELYLNSNFVDLTAIPFESIRYKRCKDVTDLWEMVDLGIDFTLDYYHCLPTVEYLMEVYEKKGGPYVEFFERLLNILLSKNLYGEFIYSLYAREYVSERLKSDINTWGPASFDELKRMNLISTKKVNTNAICFEGSAISNSNGLDEALDMAFLSDRATFYLNFVNNIQIESEHRTESEWINEEIEEITLKNDEISDVLYIHLNFYAGDYLPGKNRGNIHDYRRTGIAKGRSCIKEIWRNHPDFVREIYTKELDSENVYNGEVYVPEFDQPVFDIDPIRKLQEKSYFDIHGVICSNYYSSEFVIDINNRARKHIEYFYENKDSYIENTSAEDMIGDYEEFNSHFEWLSTKYGLYVKPILIRDSFFYFDFNERFNNRDYNYDNDELLRCEKSVYEDAKSYVEGFKREVGEDIVYVKAFISYMEEILPILENVENASERVLWYKHSLEKYFVDKDIEIYPAGLFIYEHSELEDCSKNDKLIDFSFISSGERKIILLFALNAFYGQLNLLMDEPELSLSILWQENLLPDLLTHCDNHLIIATHSPYIAANESVQEYIKYLPQKQE